MCKLSTFMETSARLVEKRNFSLIILVFDNSDHRLGQLLLGVNLAYYSLRIIQYTLRTVDRYNLP